MPLDWAQQQGECMKRIRHIFIFPYAGHGCIACRLWRLSEPVSPDCTSDGIAIIPTATRQTDPDLFSPPSPPDGGDGADYCPTLFRLKHRPKISRTIHHHRSRQSFPGCGQPEDLAATAVGDDMLAAAWLSDGDIYVALSRGGNHFRCAGWTAVTAFPGL